jgi:hypothetical protein
MALEIDRDGSEGSRADEPNEEDEGKDNDNDNDKDADEGGKDAGGRGDELQSREELEDRDGTEEDEHKAGRLAELRPQDLESAVKVYDAIRVLKAKKDPAKDKQLAAEFDQKMAGVVGQLKSGLKRELPVALKNVAILKAKCGLIGISFEKMIETNADKASEHVWKNIKTSYESVMGGLLDVIESLTRYLDPDVDIQLAEYKDLKQANGELKISLQDLLRDKQALEEEKDRTLKLIEAERTEMQERLNALEADNAKYLDALAKKPHSGRSLGLPASHSPSKPGSATKPPTAELTSESKVLSIAYCL